MKKKILNKKNPKNIKSISVVLPVYNEEENVGKLIEEANKVLSDITNDYEVIIVNDGSSDNTGQIIDRYVKEGKAVHIKHEDNLGYGNALISGFNNAKKDIVFFTDGDLQFNISELGNYINLLDKYDGVVGYRVSRKDNFIRRINAFGWKSFINFVYGLNIKDPNCAFKIFRRDVIKDIDLKSAGATINAELLIKLKDRGRSLVEVPVEHFYRVNGVASGGNPSVIIKALRDAFRLRE